MPDLRIATVDDRYKDEVVECLEKLLEAAKQGKIISICYTCERPCNAVSYGSTTIKDCYTLLGFLSRMVHVTNLSLDERSVPTDLFNGDAS